MTLHCAFIGFGKSTTVTISPTVLNGKTYTAVAHIFRRHALNPGRAGAAVFTYSLHQRHLDEVLRAIRR